MYRMPAEFEEHEGTWLAYPHEKQWKGYALKLEHIWLRMIQLLKGGEKVHLIVYDKKHFRHVLHMLKYYGIGTENVTFHYIPTNDLWMRDNGPTFVVNEDDDKKQLAIVKWGFNGWGGRYKYDLDNRVPFKIQERVAVPLFETGITMEGGNIEVNGKGVMILSESAVLNKNRNPYLTKEDAERVFRQFLGVDKIIWLTGVKADKNIGWTDDTDGHVDTLARFVSPDTVVYSWTEDKNDPKYPIVKKAREELISQAIDMGLHLNFIPLILPENGVYSTSHIGGGGGLLQKRKSTRVEASYTNFYVANRVVLVPQYANKNDEFALETLSKLFPNRKVIGINVTELAENGGEIHCVTQQEPKI